MKNHNVLPMSRLLHTADAAAIDSDYLWLFCILSNIVHTHQGFIFGPE